MLPVLAVSAFLIGRHLVLLSPLSDGTISGQSHELLLKFVHALSHDLLLGLHGASGGD
jgi:hypothetical protein